MNRPVASLVAATLLLASLAPVAAASTTIEIEATFRESFGRGAAPSNIGVVNGQVVTEVFTFTGEAPTGEPRCPVTTTGATVFTWPDGSTVTTDEHYLICFPGVSRFTPGSEVSYGNPELSDGTFSITGGSGTFEGITGSGMIRVTFAGDILVVHYSGTATLP
jgi:hypothetical protein